MSLYRCVSAYTHINRYTYMYRCTYIHISINTYILTYIQIHIHTCNYKIFHRCAHSFMHAYLNGFDLSECAEFSNYASSKVVETFGPRLTPEGYKEVSNKLKKS